MLANPKRTKDEIVQWIREYFAANGNDCCAVIGISGGKDSSVVAALCVEALGAERVIGVLMPNGRQKDIADSKLLVDTLGIASITVDIGGAYSKMVDVVGRAMPSGVSNPSKAAYGDTLYGRAVIGSRRSGGKHLQSLRGLCWILHKVR